MSSPTSEMFEDRVMLAGVMITEIMYNPNSSEPGAEFVEIYNSDPSSADISGWFLEDEDAAWGAVPATTTLAAGQVAVFINSAGGFDEATFRSEWSVPAEALVIPVTWGSLANGPSSTNEVLELKDSGGFSVDIANYEDGTNGWPDVAGGPSIYLTDVLADNNVGSNWALSTAGVDDGVNPSGPTFAVSDVGSPGRVPLPVVPGVTITETGGSTDVTEGGPTDTYSLVLNTQPTADVTVTVTSDAQSDVGNGASGAITLTFTTSNWDQPQTVTVTAIDDAVVEGPHTSKITHSAASADGDYNGVGIADLTVNVADNETPGVDIAESDGTTIVTEGGATDTYDVVLKSTPSKDVTVTVTPDGQIDLGGGAGNAITLTFTPANALIPQSVTVTAVDDALIEGNHLGKITHKAASGDVAYEGLMGADVNAKIADNDFPTVLLNEIYVNPTGGDDNREYVEILTPAAGSTSLSGLTLLMVEGDGAAAGIIDGALNLDTLTTGKNGLLLLGDKFSSANPWASTTDVDTAVADGFLANTMENGTITFMIVSNFTGTAGQDLDSDNNGTIDVTLFDAVIDSVGWTDGGAGDLNYSTALLTQSAGTPDAATRFVGNTDGESTAAWFNGDITDPGGDAGLDVDYDVAAASANLPANAKMTPGGLNILATVPGVTITESAGTTELAEGGATDTYTIVLDTQPTADVTVTVTPDAQTDLGNGAGMAITLTFTNANWDQAQMVTVTAVDDAAVEGNHSSTITHSAASSDGNYNGLSIANVIANITDNDTPGVTIVESDGSTNVSEGGATDTYTVVLDSQPTADVAITVDPDAQTDLGSGGDTAITLTFTSGNWDTPQTVTVTAVDDAVNEGKHTSKITHTVASSDGGYNGLAVTDVTANITDNDVPAPTELFINEMVINPPGTDTGHEYIELRGTPSTTITADTYLVVIEGDGGAGVIDQIFSIGGMQFGSNGYLVLLQAGNAYTTDPNSNVVTATGTGWGTDFSSRTNDIENGSTSILLIQSATAPVADDDVDAEGDGVLDGAATSWTILDSIGNLDGGVTDTAYGKINFSTDGSGTSGEGAIVDLATLTGNGYTPDYFARRGDTTGFTSDDWVASDILGTAPNFSIDSTTPNAFPVGIMGDLDHIGATNPYDLTGPGVIITESSGSTDVTEGGATDDYTLVLNTQPTADVTVTITPDAQTDLGNGAGAAITLTFTDANWDTPQTVTVTAVDDATVEGNHTSTITHSAASSDGDYNGVAITDVTVNITDNDTPGLTVVESGGSTDVVEGGATDSYMIVLDSQPTADVTVTIAPDAQTDLGSGGGTAITLTFTSANWDTPQTVTVTAVDDAVVEGNHTSTITHTIASSDTNYDGFVVGDVIVNIGDNDAPAPTELYINEIFLNPPGTDTGSEYIELRGTAGTTITSDTYLVLIEGDGGGGLIDQVFSLGGMQIGSNGFLVLLQAGSTYTTDPNSNVVTATGSGWGTDFSSRTNDIENGSTSFLLIQSAMAPTVDGDVDAEGDGILDGEATNWTFWDSIGVLDGGSADTAYGAINYSSDGDGLSGNTIVNVGLLSGNSFTPDYLARFGDTTGSMQADWLASDTLGTAPSFSIDPAAVLPALYQGDLDHIGTTNAFAPAPAVVVTESGGSTDVVEGGATDTYEVVLNTQPLADVTVTVTPDGQTDLGNGPGMSITLTFTSGNWDTPQTVTVTAVDDDLAEGNHTSTITHTVASTDMDYNTFVVVDVTANITDNDMVGVTLTQFGGTTDVTEGGATDTYTIVLDSEPTADVTVTVTPDSQTDLGSGAGMAVMLTFTSGNWETPQTVTVSAIDDAVIEGNHTSTITHAVASGDVAYDGLAIPNVTVNITDNDLPGVTITESGGTTDVVEGGATDSYEVVLDTQPTGDVTVTITPDAQTDLGAGPGAAVTLTFTNANWDTPQTVNVTAVDDAIAEGAHTSTISHTVVSGDTNYDGLAVNDVTVNITDNDTAGVTVTESSGTTDVTEDGAIDSYDIVLDSEPTADVTITVTPDAQTDLGNGAGMAVTLTFTNANWDTPQTVTVTAVDDAVVEGNHISTITHTVASGDANYDGFTVADVTVNVTDNDVAGVTITESGGSTDITEGGATDSYTVVLDTQPSADVTITVTPDSQTDLGAGVGMAVTLTFTNANWDTPQTVTVTAVDDAVVEGNHTSTITHTVASTDANYDGLGVADVTVNISDNEFATLTVVINSDSLAENGGMASATVTRNTGTSGALTVTLTSSDLTEITVPVTVTIPDGQNSVMFMIAGVDDSFDDGTRTATVTASASGFIAGMDSIEITDNDLAQIPDDILFFDETSRTFKLGRNQFTSFQWTQTNPLPATLSEYESFVGDFDGDGDLDGAVYNRDTHIVNLFTNENGGLNFAGPVGRGTAGTAGDAGFWQVGDYDGNGRDEILWLYTSGIYAGAIFTKDLMTTQVFYMATANPSYDEFLTGDFNGDGFDDLVGLFDNAAGTRTNIIPFYSIESNNPSLPRRLRPIPGSPAQGTFGQSIATDGLGNFAVADLNNDGKDDLIATTAGGLVVHATPTGDTAGDGILFVDVNRFVASNRGPTFPPAMFPGELLFGRFDDDLLIDVTVVATNGDFHAGVASLNPAFLNPVVLSSPAIPFGSGEAGGNYAVGDFNGDGYDDLASLNGANAQVYLSLGDGNTFRPPLDFGPIIGGGAGEIGAWETT